MNLNENKNKGLESRYNLPQKKQTKSAFSYFCIGVWSQSRIDVIRNIPKVTRQSNIGKQQDYNSVLYGFGD